MVDSNLSQGHIHFTIPSKRFSRVVCLLSSLSITVQSDGILPCHQLPSVGTFYIKVQIDLYVLNMCFALPGSVHKGLFTPDIGVKHPNDNIVHTYPGNCSPAPNSSASVMTVSYSK